MGVLLPVRAGAVQRQVRAGHRTRPVLRGDASQPGYRSEAVGRCLWFTTDSGAVQEDHQTRGLTTLGAAFPTHPRLGWSIIRF